VNGVCVGLCPVTFFWH